MKGKQPTNKENSKPVKKKETIKDKILELNKEFDETIYFNHCYTVFRKMQVEKPISQTTIPFLMIREFLFSYFEEKLINKEADKESITQIIGHIKQFSNSHDESFIRNFLENIKTYAEMIGIKNTSNILVPALAKIVDESFHAKLQFLKALLPFIDYLCSNGDEGINILRNNMINIIQELYHQKSDQIVNEEMKKYLFKNFIKIARAILPYDKEQYILNIIISFGNEDIFRTNLNNNLNNSKNQKVDEHKILCIRYIRKLAEGFGKENAERYLLPQLISFTIEKNDIIKKELLMTLPIISEIVSYEYISNKVYDILRRISTDLNPILRKMCINVLAKVIKIFKNKCEIDMKNNPDSKKNKENKKYSAKNFIDLVEKLSKDKENNVKFTIIEKIGEIISTLDQDELSKELFDFYKQFVEKYYENKKNKLPLMATTQTTSTPLYKKLSSGSNSLSGGNYSYLNDDESDDYNEINNMENEFNKQITEEELNYYFAYNFPAILYCYGKKAWPELKAIYFDFCFEEDLKIRLSIIASFHEIVNILGKEMTQNELLPVYDKFLESNEKYEQKLAINNLPKILIKVDKKIKERYFKYFEPVSIFIDNTGNKVRTFNFINWKNKLNVIEGILCYYNLYDNDIIYTSILPQCITFSLDKFYKVRKTSAKVLATLIVYLYKENYKKDKLIKILETFAFHKKFKIRINFIKMCPVLLSDENLYKEKIKEMLEIIVNKEKILDVKIALSKVLKKIIIDEKAVLCKDDSIHKFCNILCKNEIIKKLMDGVTIKNVNNENNNINLEDKNYFTENNLFFIEEFKIEYEKKDNKLLFCDEIKNNNKNNEDKKDKEEEKEINKIEEINTKQDEKVEEKKEDKKEIENEQLNNNNNEDTNKTENKNEEENKKDNTNTNEDKTTKGEKEEKKEDDNKEKEKEKEKENEEVKEDKKEEEKKEDKKEDENKNENIEENKDDIKEEEKKEEIKEEIKEETKQENSEVNKDIKDEEKNKEENNNDTNDEKKDKGEDTNDNKEVVNEEDKDKDKNENNSN